MGSTHRLEYYSRYWYREHHRELGTAGQNGMSPSNCRQRLWETSAANSLAVTVTSEVPATPGAITGTAAQCPALTGQTYNITAVANATKKTWTEPQGEIVQPVLVPIESPSQQEQQDRTEIAPLTAGNSCEAVRPNSLAVTVTSGVPATPHCAITGTAAQCLALTGQTYNITAVGKMQQPIHGLYLLGWDCNTYTVPIASP